MRFFDRGLAYANKGDTDRAIADYTEAIRLNPNYANAFSNRGLAYLKKGDNDRAIAEFNEAIRLDPKHASAFSAAAPLIRVRATPTARLPITTRRFD